VEDKKTLQIQHNGNVQGVTSCQWQGAIDMVVKNSKLVRISRSYWHHKFAGTMFLCAAVYCISL